VKPANHRISPDWPPPDGAYDYLSTISWRDWAWEGLRRNPAYQAEARAVQSSISISSLEGGALLTRMQERVLPAEAWALCCFH
jgi:hypothetical protein